tara:strand:+ start:93 stop:575 length:483 start_codon:yes stop_codon:yes gene_type:complete
MILIEEYMEQTQVARQQHLQMNEPCIERGGQSMYLKGLMAHILGTSIPSGHKIHVCHACHNAKCSNPNHLYFGTPSENAIDRETNNPSSIWAKTVKKHGLERAKEIQRNNSDPSKAGKGNLGKPKSDAHRQAIAEAVKKQYQQSGRISRGGRPTNKGRHS